MHPKWTGINSPRGILQESILQSDLERKISVRLVVVPLQKKKKFGLDRYRTRAVELKRKILTTLLKLIQDLK